MFCRVKDETRSRTGCQRWATPALVGIGAIEPSPLLAQSGNIFAPQELELLRRENAVGDILMRFYDQGGNLVKTGLENRVISMSLVNGAALYFDMAG